MEINTTQDNKNSNQCVRFDEVNLGVGDGFRFGFGFGAGIFIWSALIMTIIITASIMIGGSIINAISKNFLTATTQSIINPSPKSLNSERTPFFNFK